jgi:hypothetical protein
VRSDDDDGRGPGCKHEGQGGEHCEFAHVPLSVGDVLYRCR